jgi:hypothetical protein
MIPKKAIAGREYYILNEIEILKKVSKGHPNVITLHDFFETPNNSFIKITSVPCLRSVHGWRAFYKNT